MSAQSEDEPRSLIDKLNRRRQRVAAEARGETAEPGQATEVGQAVDGEASLDDVTMAGDAGGPDTASVGGELDDAQAENEASEEAALSDEALLEKYDLPDPETVDDEAGLDKFFKGDMPERLRQMALRRVWRLNPLFRFADEMVEYGEDYTDAATVVEGMQTAYQVGKGYLKKVTEALEGEATEASGDATDGTKTKAADSREEDTADSDEDSDENSVETPDETPDSENAGDSAGENAGDSAGDSADASAGDSADASAGADAAAQQMREPPKSASLAEQGIRDETAINTEEGAAAELADVPLNQEVRPRRMVFRKS